MHYVNTCNQIALIYRVIKARKPEKKPDKNVKSPWPKKDRKCEDRNNPIADTKSEDPGAWKADNSPAYIYGLKKQIVQFLAR